MGPPIVLTRVRMWGRRRQKNQCQRAVIRERLDLLGWLGGWRKGPRAKDAGSLLEPEWPGHGLSPGDTGPAERIRAQEGMQLCRFLAVSSGRLIPDF